MNESTPNLKAGMEKITLSTYLLRYQNTWQDKRQINVVLKVACH